MNLNSNHLEVSCPSFGENGEIPKRHTGFGEDISPEILLGGLSNKVKTIAIIMDDLDVPMIKEYTHWIIWNLPAVNCIPENIPHGEECPDGAKQGKAWGKHKYRGPKQPPFIKRAHRYRFAAYGLDCILNLPATSGKADLVKAMSGHILQSGAVTGWYKP